LKGFTKRIFHQEIPTEIGADELIVRGIMHPFFYSFSKKTIKPEAFLPAPEKNDVSLLRRNFTTDDFCKNHSQSIVIPGHQYCGLAAFMANAISKVDALSGFSGIAKIVGSPIDKNGNYIKSKKVFKNDPGLPMHADLLYLKPPTRGEPQTTYRKYAKEIIKLSKYYSDPSPDSPGWHGQALINESHFS